MRLRPVIHRICVVGTDFHVLDPSLIALDGPCPFNLIAASYCLAPHAPISGGPLRLPTIVSGTNPGGGATPADQKLPTPLSTSPFRSTRAEYQESFELINTNDTVSRSSEYMVTPDACGVG
jgi:hypothetical protein